MLNNDCSDQARLPTGLVCPMFILAPSSVVRLIMAGAVPTP